jgi:hypothetical protein
MDLKRRFIFPDDTELDARALLRDYGLLRTWKWSSGNLINQRIFE